jgi:acetyltransferase EpsM
VNKKVIIIGGEGNGGVIAACIENNRNRFHDLEWEVQGFVNDYEKTVSGYPVLGGTYDIQSLLNETNSYFMWGIHMIGRNILTEQMYRKANIPKERFATIIHKSAFVADNSTIEPGVFINTNCYIGSEAHIGQCSMVMANSLIGHNAIIGSLCHFSSGSNTSSYVKTGLCSDVALGAIVLEKIKIGNFAVAGAGALILHDIPDYEIHIGNPAKFLKKQI